MRVVVCAFAGIGDGETVSADRGLGSDGELTAAIPRWVKALKHVGWLLLLALLSVSAMAQGLQAGEISPVKEVSPPPGVVQARRFLAQRGWTPGQTVRARRFSAGLASARPQSTAAAAATWEPLGPKSVLSAHYGLVSGRVTSVAFDPADVTGNRVYVGTTGGGVWLSQNAATSNPGNVVFSPLTDTIAAMSGAQDASISIGALTVQPGGTGVVLAGTGDPNDGLDSYYGAGVLRSVDGGKTWSVVQITVDHKWAFVGEGIAGFAWSTVSPQLVVAAVSQAWEGALVAAPWPHLSYQGLYYSADSGATWSLARIADLNDLDVQGPNDAYAGPDGNAATSVVWNPVRRLFVAAVRFHGYYQSSDGITWTRLASQPGPSLTTKMCPTDSTLTGSTGCPIYRGTLAVNPRTGDTFAWTVDLYNQDQGIWHDVCAPTGGTCTNPALTFAKQWNTTGLQTDTWLGRATIQNGDYTLALAAVPSDQDTVLLAGANDLWKCSLAMACVWRNTTNTDSCMSAQVASFQHALAWNDPNPLELFIGNDSGLWRSSDGIGETGPVCASSDASHFQNLNGSFGSLANVASMSPVGDSPYTMMVGLGVNGAAGVKATTGPTAIWPQILDGEGGPVAIDPTDPTRWYVNNGAGVSIHLCAQPGNCTSAAFGVSPVISEVNVGNDGMTMTTPAPFIVDPLDPTQLLIGTCRVWRGPANGLAWTAGNAVSPVLDGNRSSSYCSGDALIRTMAAMVLPGGGEIVYAGMYGVLNGGATLPGHVLSATMSPGGVWSAWQDLSLNPVTNDNVGMNLYGFDISSLTIDPLDSTGMRVVATVAGYMHLTQIVRVIYRSTDGGTHWAIITSNLPPAPATAFVLDPKDSETAYLATDLGVFSTQRLSHCADNASNCWSAFGSGLPGAPVVALSAAPVTGSLNVLAAATYGRGVWQVPLLSAGIQMTSVTVDPSSLIFDALPQGAISNSQTVTLTNTGSIALSPTLADASGDFSETDNCVGHSLDAGAICTVQVIFAPSQTGNRIGQLTISANVAGGQLAIPLSGMGLAAGLVTLSPPSIYFGRVQAGSTSVALQVTAENRGGVAVPVSDLSVSGPFVVSSNACSWPLAANASCQITVKFEPATAGMVTGVLTMVDGVGTQTVQLSGIGDAPATDTLSSTSLSFPGTIIGALSAPQTVALTNTGDVPLTSIAVSVSGPYQVSTNCTTQLTGQSSCSINVVSAPTAAGIQPGTLTVSDLIKTQTVPLTGIGLLPPVISVSPVSLTFPTQPVGVAGAPLVLTVSNTGGAPMGIVGFQITGQSAGSFSTGTTTCGASLANGRSCTVPVTFTSGASGMSADSLVVSTSTLGVAPVAVPLSGTGKAPPGLSTSPVQLIFAAQALGQTSAPQTVTILNNGGTNAGGFVIATSGPFSVAQNTCGTTLAAGASCSTGVVFAPTSSGNLTGALTASSTTVTTPATVALSGIGGLTGAVSLQPSLINFPTTGVGIMSSAVSVTITNISNTVAMPSLALGVSAGFILGSNSCGASLAPGANCTVGVQFAPSTSGLQTGTLALTSSGMAAAASVALSGVGFDFSASAGGSASKTVASGQTATYTLNLAPSAGGGVATFTSQCGTLPLYAACVLNPASESIAADATGTQTIQVTTSQNKAFMMLPASPGKWVTWPLACGLLMIPFAITKRRRMLLLILLLGLVVGGASSCASSGGGSGGNTPAPTSTASNTPAGTYSIPVTITSNGVQHVVTLTLIVD